MVLGVAVSAILFTNGLGLVTYALQHETAHSSLRLEPAQQLSAISVQACLMFALIYLCLRYHHAFIDGSTWKNIKSAYDNFFQSRSSFVFDTIQEGRSSIFDEPDGNPDPFDEYSYWIVNHDLDINKKYFTHTNSPKKVVGGIEEFYLIMRLSLEGSRAWWAFLIHKPHLLEYMLPYALSIFAFVDLSTSGKYSLIKAAIWWINLDLLDTPSYPYISPTYVLSSVVPFG